MNNPEPAPAGIPTWQGAVSARITRSTGVDTIEEIDYTDGLFTRRVHVIGGPTPPLVVVLDLAARQQLLGELRQELANPPAGTDIVALRTFTELLEDSVTTEGSDRFAEARFGRVTHDETRGVYFGHVGLGVDVVGTVRDDRGILSFEQHVVTMLRGSYRALSPADQASLTAALSRYLDNNNAADPGWRQILTDAQRGAQG